MFSIIRNTIENRKVAKAARAASEIYPELYLKRKRAIERNRISEAVGLLAVFAMGAAFVFIWLAYEGWITPETFKAVLH